MKAEKRCKKIGGTEFVRSTIKYVPEEEFVFWINQSKIHLTRKGGRRVEEQSATDVGWVMAPFG